MAAATVPGEGFGTEGGDSQIEGEKEESPVSKQLTQLQELPEEEFSAKALLPLLTAMKESIDAMQEKQEMQRRYEELMESNQKAIEQFLQQVKLIMASVEAKQQPEKTTQPPEIVVPTTTTAPVLTTETVTATVAQSAMGRPVPKKNPLGVYYFEERPQGMLGPDYYGDFVYMGNRYRKTFYGYEEKPREDVQTPRYQRPPGQKRKADQDYGLAGLGFTFFGEGASQTLWADTGQEEGSSANVVPTTVAPDTTVDPSQSPVSKDLRKMVHEAAGRGEITSDMAMKVLDAMKPQEQPEVSQATNSLFTSGPVLVPTGRTRPPEVPRGPMFQPSGQGNVGGTSTQTGGMRPFNPTTFFGPEARRLWNLSAEGRKNFKRLAPKKFTEKDDWDEFIIQFECHLAGLDIQDEYTMVVVLSTFLEGAPQQKLKNMRKENPSLNYIEAKYALQSAFRKKVDRPLVGRDALKMMWDRNRETLHAFYERLVAKHQEAFLHFDTQHSQELQALVFQNAMPKEWSTKMHEHCKDVYTASALFQYALQLEENEKFQKIVGLDKEKKVSVKKSNVAATFENCGSNNRSRPQNRRFDRSFVPQGRGGQALRGEPEAQDGRGFPNQRRRRRRRGNQPQEFRGRGQNRGNRGVRPRGYGSFRPYYCTHCRNYGHTRSFCRNPPFQGEGSVTSGGQTRGLLPNSGQTQTREVQTAGVQDVSSAMDIVDTTAWLEEPAENFLRNGYAASCMVNVNPIRCSSSGTSPIQGVQGVEELKAHDAVGYAVVYPLTVQGELVPDPLIDSGAKVTIISKLFLQHINRKKPKGWLEGRVFQFWGEVVVFGGAVHKNIKKVVMLEVVADTKKATIPCLVNESPEPEGPFLLGENGMRALGFRLLSPDGTPIMPPPQADVNKVQHFQKITVAKSAVLTSKHQIFPAQTVKDVPFRPVEKMVPFKAGDSFCFFPDPSLLDAGFASVNAVLKADAKGQLSVPLHNLHTAPQRISPKMKLGEIQPFTEEYVTVESLEDLPEELKVEKIVESFQLMDQRKKDLTELLHPEDWTLTPEPKDFVLKLFLGQHEMFAITEAELGEAEGLPVEIDTGEAEPIHSKSRRVCEADLQDLKEKLQQLLRAGILEKSNSPWSFPLVLVRKKDSGELRVCVDYTKLNDVTKKDRYPLPNCMQLLEAAGSTNPRYFSTLDLRSGYHQILMSEDAKLKSALTCPYGLYQYTRMPFGLTNAPAIFQRYVDWIFNGMAERFGVGVVSVYIDDILICTKTYEEHIQVLGEVLRRLRNAGMKIHPKKCRFFRESVKFLGFVLTCDGLKADHSKVESIAKFPTPETITNLKSFLGLCSYYRRFVQNFSQVAFPLTKLLRGSGVKLEWSSEAQTAFDLLKSLMMTPPVLAYPDPYKPYIVETDASTIGLGAVLEQIDSEMGKVRPIAYASCTLSPTQSRYWIGDLEMFAIVYALKQFRPIILRRNVLIVTDSDVVIKWLNKEGEVPNDRVHRWKGFILNFPGCTVIFRKGQDNFVADALSRNPLPNDVKIGKVQSAQSQMTNPNLAIRWLEEVKELQERDVIVAAVKCYIQTGKFQLENQNFQTWMKKCWKQFRIIRGILYYIDWRPKMKNPYRIYVPESERNQLCLDLHASPVGGHLGKEKLYAKMQEHFYWPRMAQFIQSFVRSCSICAARSGQARKKIPPLQPIATPEYPFQHLGMDILKLPLSHKGNNYALIMTDLFSCFAVVEPLRKQTAQEVVQAFLKVVMMFGPPMKVTTDKGVQFTSDLCSHVCDVLKVQQLFTTTFHPQADGQAERFNRTLCDMLAKVSKDSKGADWDEMLIFVVFAYNTSLHARTQQIPFNMVFGREAWQISNSAFSHPVLFCICSADGKEVIQKTRNEAEAARTASETSDTEREAL